jgi:nucleotide-binding universal stress UspA family protein
VSDLKLLFANDGVNPLDETIRDFRRAGLPERGKALVLSLQQSHREHNETDSALAAKQLQSLLPAWEVSVESVTPSSADVVLRTAAWWSPDLLIMGCRKKPEPFSDNLAFDVVHRARCSVRMVTPSSEANNGPIRLIVADDGSAGAQSAVRMVERRSWPSDTEVRVLAVGENAHSGSPDSLMKLGLKVSKIQVEGDPRQVLVREAEAWNSDAIFIGAHGSSSANRFLLGSVSTAVVTRLRRTVEVVR